MELKESEYTYDQKFKQLFGNIKFLAPILKNIIKEYKDLSLPEIEALVISVQDGEEVVTNLGVEDVGKGDESKTFYDVVAGCRLPGKKETLLVDLYFDLEMQREKNPGYPAPHRGIYYCSRLISRQLTNLEEGGYERIKPVYSVWIIVNDIPKPLRYSRHEFALSGTNSRMEESRGYSEKRKKEYDAAVDKLNAQADLIHFILVFLSEDFTEPGELSDGLLKYLQAVFLKKAGDPAYNPYAEYSKSIAKEADEFMTVVGMFEKRGENRLKELLYYLKQQGREEEIDRIICSESGQLLEKLYAEFNLQNKDWEDER